MDTSNIYRFNGVDPFDDWTIKNNKIMGFYGRNSLISQLSSGGVNGVINDKHCLPNDVKVIGRSAFRNCLKTFILTISDGVEEIEDYAFYQSSFKNIFIPESVKRIAINAFSKMNGTTIVVIKDSYAHKWAIRHNIKYLVKDKK